MPGRKAVLAVYGYTFYFADDDVLSFQAYWTQFIELPGLLDAIHQQIPLVLKIG